MSNPVLLLRAVTVLVAVAAAAPAAAHAASLTVEGYGGWQHLQLSRQSVGSAIGGSEGTGLFGGDLLLDLGGPGLGVAVDKTVGGDAQPWAGSIMAGFLPELLGIRLELLGEIGRRARDFGDIFDSPGATFLGLRPGVSFRLAASPLRIGVGGLVRWPTSNGDFGSPDYSVIGKIGFEFP
jgi:hypothetical protein